MATKLSVKEALGQFFRNFATGQGVGSASYTGYAPDQDLTFSAILETVDQMIDEIAAFTGQNSLLQQDLVQGIGPSTTSIARTLDDGIVGARSFTVTRITANTQVQVDAGVALAQGARIQTSQFIATSSGGAGTRFIALNADGSISVNVTAAGGVLDLYSISWNGTIFDAEAVRLARVYPEGDDFQALLAVTGLAGGAIPPQANLDFSQADRILEQVVERFRNIESVLNGLRTNALTGGPALGDIVIPGTAGAPGLVFGDGVSTIDAATGLFRQALNAIGISAAGVERLRVTTQGLLAAQAGSAATPVLSRTGDLDTGIFFPAGDQMALGAGGRTALRLEELSNIARALLSGDGTAAAPDLSWIGDLDTGLYRLAANEAAITTGGVQAMRWASNQQPHADGAFRVRARRTATQSLTSGVNTAILFTAADTYDVGALHDNVTNSQNIVVPTAGDGLYKITAQARFASVVTPGATEYRLIEIRVNGTVQREVRVRPVDSQPTSIEVSEELELVAADIVTVTVEQNSGGALNLEDASAAAVRLW